MIGYYVHHQGLGHLTRARCIAAATDRTVVALTSAPSPAGPEPFADRVVLPRDDRPDDLGQDPEAGGVLHWAPRGSAGYRARMERLAAWVADARPAVVVVDASVEVTALVRLLGVPVVLVAAPGRRVDRPHRIAHRLAARVIAPWPAEVLRPDHLDAATVYCGAISRFDGRRPALPARAGDREVLVLLGAGGSVLGPDDVAAARRHTPGWRWRTAGLDRWADGDTVWAALQSADVVVCHGGQNVLAEVAAARRPAVVLPQARPFAEQDVTTAALADAGIVVAAPSRPPDRAWPGLLEHALGLGGAGWARWSHGDGARRAATAVEAVADGDDSAGRAGG